MDKKIQIYGTLGPACKKQEVLEQMFLNGLTGMRLNLSHTGLRESEEIVSNFRNAASAVGIVPQLLIDMQGPELRVGNLIEAIVLSNDREIWLTAADLKMDLAEEDQKIPVPAEVIQTLNVQDEVLLDDGKLLVKVKEVYELSALCQVIRGGKLTGHKSVKIIGKQVEMPVLTAHDLENIRLAKEYGVTGLMQPFVRSGKDLALVRRMLADNQAENVKIFAKIENRAALTELDSIIRESDVIIIARGDLGNDMDLWELPAVQKDIEAACIKANKPFIVVTQMLASMEENPVPTRAEVSDIFNAVADGAYGVMITGESAVGKYPVEAVRYLANTANMAAAWMGRHKKE